MGCFYPSAFEGQTWARLAEKQTAGAVTAADVQRARFKWIHSVNALCALLELESGFPTEGLDPTETEGDETTLDQTADAQG